MCSACARMKSVCRASNHACLRQALSLSFRCGCCSRVHNSCWCHVLTPTTDEEQVQVKQNYHAKVELETYLEQNGVSDASRAEDDLSAKQQTRYRKLCAGVKQEQKQNNEDTQIYFGRELRHSMPVQLLHVKSQKVCLPQPRQARVRTGRGSGLVRVR